MEKEIKNSILNTTSKFRTICEVHREMWDIIDQLKNEDIKNQLRDRIMVAYDMGKRMDKRLKFYKKDWDSNMWEKNLDSGVDRKYRKKRKSLMESSKNLKNTIEKKEKNDKFI